MQDLTYPMILKGLDRKLHGLDMKVGVLMQFW